jgi:hypothetical protein
MPNEHFVYYTIILTSAQQNFLICSGIFIVCCCCNLYVYLNMDFYTFCVFTICHYYCSSHIHTHTLQLRFMNNNLLNYILYLLHFLNVFHRHTNTHKLLHFCVQCQFGGNLLKLFLIRLHFIKNKRKMFAKSVLHIVDYPLNCCRFA